MADNPSDYFVRIEDTLVGRKAGSSASEKARALRSEHPTRTRAERLLRKRTDERSWRRGASGERVVGWLLDRLPDGWHVFHDIPVGTRGANIDHVVVGPAGVFTINTKNLRGKASVAPRTLRVNGYRTDHLPKAVREAARASKLLSKALGRNVDVRAVLALIVDELEIRAQPADAFVGTPRGVKRWLLGLPPSLTHREVIEICGAAARPSAWAPPGR